MNVKDIVAEHLTANGFDGLCDPIMACGCGLDDFMPCDNAVSVCQPAYRLECPKHGRYFGLTREAVCSECVDWDEP